MKTIKIKVTEIVERPNGAEHTTEEMILVIEHYILIRKGTVVITNIYKDLNPSHPFYKFLLKEQLEKVTQAFKAAQEYLLRYKELIKTLTFL